MLKRKAADLEVVDVSDDEAQLDWLAKKTGRDTIPQIWVGDTYVGGYDDLVELDRAGKLDPLLAG